MVIAATNDQRVDRAIFREAKIRKILVNAVDAPAQCDFYFPAIVRRGNLQVAISSSGKALCLPKK